MAGFDDDWGESSFGNAFDSNNDGFDEFNSDSKADSGFGNDNSFGNDDFSNSFGSSEETDTNNNFSNTNLSDNTSEESGFVKRNAIKLVIAGVVLIIFVLILGAALSKKKQPRIENDNTVNVETRDVTSEIQSGNTSQTSRTSFDTFGSGDWVEIDNEQDVEFDKESKLRFTITEIKHLARKVSVGDRVEVKTVLYGSISGLQGTYQLEVSYDKGKKLNVGNEFDINVQMGEYKGKPVVGRISY